MYSAQPVSAPRSTTPKTSTLRAILVALGFFLAFISPLGAQQAAWWTAQETPLVDHVVGDSVVGHVTGVAPDQVFELVLEDEGQRVVASARVTSDPHGRIPVTLLWPRSGVVGCDGLNGFGDTLPDSGAYRFARYAEAEQILAGRTFRLRLLVAETELEVTGHDLPFRIGAKARFFLSDGTGCPRNTLADHEDAYLGGMHVPEGLDSVYVFLVKARDAWALGDPLSDARPEYQETPQLVELDGSGSLIELLWPGSGTMKGKFEAFVRESGVAPMLSKQKDDWWTRTPPFPCHSRDGLTIPDVQVEPNGGPSGCGLGGP